jgi:hypothetical protein
VKIFEVAVRANLVPIFIKAADSGDSVAKVKKKKMMKNFFFTFYQMEALRALAFLAPGPRIASTPVVSKKKNFSLEFFFYANFFF